MIRTFEFDVLYTLWVYPCWTIAVLRNRPMANHLLWSLESDFGDRLFSTVLSPCEPHARIVDAIHDALLFMLRSGGIFPAENSRAYDVVTRRDTWVAVMSPWPDLCTPPRRRVDLAVIEAMRLALAYDYRIEQLDEMWDTYECRLVEATTRDAIKHAQRELIHTGVLPTSDVTVFDPRRECR